MDGGTTWSTGVRFRMDGQTGAAGNNGNSLLEIYQRGATAPSAPTLTYDGTSFANLGSWSRTIPATPATQNLYAMTANYVVGTTGITLDPVIYLKGLAMAAPVSPHQHKVIVCVMV